MERRGDTPDWTGAACIGRNPDGFFPERGTAQITARDAKRVCNGVDGEPACPLRAMCLEYALTNKERFGIWGGKSERERAKIAKDRRVATRRRELEEHRRRERRRAAAIAAWEKRRRAEVEKGHAAKPVASRSKGTSGKSRSRRAAA